VTDERLARSLHTVLPLALLFLIVRPDSSPQRLPPLPPLPPSSEAHGRAADPLNIVFLGSAADLDQAFRAAGWTRASHKSFASLVHEAFAVLARRPDAHAPVSTQRVAGRPQDVAYELPGPTARVRDHVRLWQVGGNENAWAGAATQDVGMLVNPFKRRLTHRIAPALDDERDRIIAVLRLDGCADLLGYVRLAGAVQTGRNATSQRFFTDGRTAVMRVHGCRRGN
jgi:hypothetical protein